MSLIDDKARVITDNAVRAVQGTGAAPDIFAEVLALLMQLLSSFGLCGIASPQAHTILTRQNLINRATLRLAIREHVSNVFLRDSIYQAATKEARTWTQAEVDKMMTEAKE